MKVPCVIYFGLILMIDVVGESVQEELDTRLVKILVKLLTTIMV